MIGSTRDVVIIGAGVIGTAIAYLLSQERLKVTVLDPQPVGEVLPTQPDAHILL
jgi:glycine/D-amino acid oxidase-like deaminating enzyme